MSAPGRNGSRADATAGVVVDPIEQLVRRTRRRLAVLTLALIAALLLIVGGVTAIVAIRLMEDTIDRSLDGAASAAIATLGEEPGETESGPSGDDESEDGSGPVASPEATGAETEEREPGPSDTFFLVLDASGGVVTKPSGMGLAGLPDASAVAAAAASAEGRDQRDGTYAGRHVRLLTLCIPADEGNGTAGYLQAGYVLTVHDQQETELVWTIIEAGVLGLLGAAIVTLLITRRALGPIRAAFSTERRFVASASHELRTPVAVIRASAEILQREDLVAEAGQPLVADVIAEADRLSRLVGDLLGLASAEAGAMPVDRQVVDLVPMVTELGRRAGSMATSHGLTLETELPGDPTRLTVLADSERLAQLLLILLENAYAHSPSGGTVRLTLAHSIAQRGSAEITVSDQGPGVPAAERERIFEPFARLTERPHMEGGSGLGLAIARLLAVRHEASLWVDDAPGGGARFTLRLPAVDASR